MVMKGLKKRINTLKSSKVTLRKHHNRAFFKEQESESKIKLEQAKKA